MTKEMTYTMNCRNTLKAVEKNVEKLEMAETPDEILDSLKLLIK